MMNKAETAAYQRGYQAGRRKGKNQTAEMLLEINQTLSSMERAQQPTAERVFLSVFNGLIASPKTWTMSKGGENEKQVSTSRDYVELANRITSEILRNGKIR